MKSSLQHGLYPNERPLSRKQRVTIVVDVAGDWDAKDVEDTLKAVCEGRTNRAPGPGDIVHSYTKVISVKSKFLRRPTR